jgi:hypothetical protein
MISNKSAFRHRYEAATEKVYPKEDMVISTVAETKKAMVQKS